MKTLIKNGTIINANESKKANILIQNDKIIFIKSNNNRVKKSEISI